MGGQTRQSSMVWALARRQHGVITRRQLLELGFTRHGISHRIARGRLHPARRDVFAVGAPGLGHLGRWMAAVLYCGEDTILSHTSAAALWKIRSEATGLIHVSTPRASGRNASALRLHRRRLLGPADRTARSGIPVTSPLRTLADLATILSARQLEAAVNEADKLDLVDPEGLRVGLDGLRGPGTSALRKMLDRLTFVLTDSELERRFLPIARRAGLPLPETGRWLDGFEVDFFWPDLGLVVETDGLRYHRTPAEQARDRLRDQAHTAAGLTPLRFTHAQVRFESDHVSKTLARMAKRLQPQLRL